MKKFKSLFIFLATYVLFFIMTTQLVLAESPDTYTLQVPLLNYTESQNIAEYIATIYQYSMIVLIPLLIIVIIIAGISWVAAGGDMTKIKAARARITSGFIGLGIALLSYVLLNLVGINALTMGGVQTIKPEIGDDLIIYETNSTLPGTPGSYPSVGGQCFPVAANSFVSNSNNFKANRAGGGRYHAGVDLITKEPAYGIAMADGVVTAISSTFKGKSPCGPKDGCCSKGWFAEKYGPKPAGKIMIYFPSLNVTANYGEVDSSTIKVKVGDSVTAGQVLGVFGPCRMVHFELYKGKTSNSTPWYQGSAQPASLLDPTNTLSSLQSKMCGG